ncbi:uncharacterized protein [Muntiacus reevesi]|uniref:uncharacterized protein n=1 Tax=Muntiacus reevesi TaxID=9886 RepID=UPI0033073650
MLEVGICPRRPGPSRAAPAATGSPEGRRSRRAPELGFVLWIRDLSALDRQAVKVRWVWRGPDGHLPGKVSSEVVGGEGRGRVATSWGRSRPGSPPRFPSRAGDAGRGRGRGGEGRERGRRGERRNLPPLAASLSAPGLGTKGGTLMNSLSAPLPRTRGYLPLATLPPRLSPLSGRTKVSERLEDRDKGSVSSKCDQVGKKCSQVATEASTPSMVRSCGIRVRLPRGIQESQRAQACQPHTYTTQSPRKRVRITGKETANQLQGCIAAGTPSFSWLPELLLLSPGFGFSMAHGNAASSVYAAQKKDLLVELWPGFPRTEARGFGGQGDAGEDLGWDG